MKNWIGLIFFLLFFAGSNLLNTLGIDVTFFFYSLMGMAAIALLLKFNRKMYNEHRLEVALLGFILLMILFRQYRGMAEDSIRNAAILLATPLFYMLVAKDIKTRSDLQIKKKIIRIIISFYVFECLLAIGEYILKTHIFLWVDTVFESHLQIGQSQDSFRSVALHGAPLGNALLVTILNSFFINSTMKDKYKFLLWGLGFFAVLAFNARMAVIVNLALLLIYLARLAYAKRTKASTKVTMYLGVTAFLGVASYFIAYKGLGDRLFKTELIDDNSAQTRLDVFSVFDSVNVMDLFLGRSMREFLSIQDAAGLFIIENFWVGLTLLFGMGFVIGLVFFYIKIFRSYLQGYTLFNKMLLCTAFVFLASTNNSLFTQYMPLLTFLICLNLFRPVTLQLILPKKYINEYPNT